MITLVAPLVARFALQFGAAEKFGVYFLAFCSFVGLSKEPPFKTVVSMMIGFALAAVGLDQMTGQLRLTFGFTELLAGFDFLIAVIGLFGIGEILLTMEEGLQFKGKRANINPRVVLQTWLELPRYWATSIRSCIIGCWMGITPAGATPASFMSYGIAKRMSPRGKNFGKGEIEGVVAPETAAHAAGTSALLPMLSLGVPGSPTAAVLLGGLLIWGLQPGPLLFVEQKEFVWGLIASMYLGNIVGLIIVLTCVPLLAAMLRIPFPVIAPVILVLCAIGAYTVHNNPFDVVMMMVFGVLGYVLKKCDYPLAPLVLALGARRQGRGSVPASAARIARQRDGVLVERPGRLDHAAWPDCAVLADHSERYGAASPASGGLIQNAGLGFDRWSAKQTRKACLAFVIASHTIAGILYTIKLMVLT